MVCRETFITFFRTSSPIQIFSRLTRFPIEIVKNMEIFKNLHLSNGLLKTDMQAILVKSSAWIKVQMNNLMLEFH